eukprot:1206717-Amphidinium_carterae.1
MVKRTAQPNHQMFAGRCHSRKKVGSKKTSGTGAKQRDQLFPKHQEKYTSWKRKTLEYKFVHFFRDFGSSHFGSRLSLTSNPRGYGSLGGLTGWLSPWALCQGAMSWSPRQTSMTRKQLAELGKLMGGNFANWDSQQPNEGQGQNKGTRRGGGKRAEKQHLQN